MSNKNLERSEVKKARGGKTKIYLLVLSAGAGLVAYGLFYQNDNPGSVSDSSDKVPEIKVEEQKDDTAGNYLEGVLNNSDDLKLGNLKLVSNGREIYLKTARDFSKLVGLQVIVLINGTMDKFELLDIQSKVSNDSYILPQ